MSDNRPPEVAGIVVVVTEGSRWEFWETEHKYRRSPRNEASRENPAWGGPEAGPMQDFVWHPFTDWYVSGGTGWTKLVILLPDGRRIRAPWPNATTGVSHSCAASEDVADEHSIAKNSG